MYLCIEATNFQYWAQTGASIILELNKRTELGFCAMGGGAGFGMLWENMCKLKGMSAC